MADDFGMGYALGADSGGGNNSGMFGGDGWLGLILFAMIFGNGGWGGGFGGGVGLNGALTRAELYDSFAMQNIDGAVRGIQQGICDSTYALNNSIMGGFHGVDNAICNLGYNMQQGFNTLGYQNQQCCCETQRLIERGFCDLNNGINTQTRDIIDNQNANYRGIMDFLVSEKLASKDARIAELTNQLSQSNQNAVIGARIDAAVAELLRRTGNDCPTAAYLVQPPTPVNFPTNGCGTVQFNGWGGNGCGCGCG
jgi:hypothetical protein